MSELISANFLLLIQIFKDVLLNYYQGDGLFVNIESISIDYISEEDEDLINISNSLYKIKLAYGRYIPEKDFGNFNQTVTLSGCLADKIEFTKGKFAQLVEQYEFGDDNPENSIDV